MHPRYAAGLALTLFTSLAHAQIPNAHFEQWATVDGSLEPTGWGTLNAVAPVGDPLVDRVAGVGGGYAMRLTTRSIFGTAVAAGAVSGTFNGEGFAWTERSAALNGSLKFTPGAEGDGATLTIALSRWNAAENEREHIGQGFITWDIATTDWTDFSVPISFGTEQAPDTALIIFTSSTATVMGVGTELIVDDLSLGANSVGLAPTAAPGLDVRVLAGSELLQVLHGAGPLATIRVCDATGRTVRELRTTDPMATIGIGGLAPGVHVVLLQGSDGRLSAGRFVKQ